MSLSHLPKTLVVAALFASTGACAAPSGDGQQDEALGESAEAVGSCQPAITTAAITKQITSIEEPTTLLVELVTISPKPYQLSATAMNFPSGFFLKSIKTTSCVDFNGTAWKCRHQAVTQVTTATSGTGSYRMYFTGVADSGSGCQSGGVVYQDFSLTTETWTETTLDTLGSEAIVYAASDYGSWALGLQEGAYTFTGNLAGANDQVSSLRVLPGWKITLYETGSFGGRSKTFTSDSAFVGWDFNDIASSVVVSRQ